MKNTSFFQTLRHAQEKHLKGEKVPRRLLKKLKELRENGVFIPYYQDPHHIELFEGEIEQDKSY